MDGHVEIRVHVWPLRRLDAWEGDVVRRMLVPRTSMTRALAVVSNHLANGWLFAGVAVLIPLWAGPLGWRCVAVIAAALAIAFSAYPFLKRRLARVRPCHASEHLDAGVTPLDRYSCPSGHMMTATIFALPLSILFPHAAVVALPVCALIAWSRISLGHHYPTDVLAGGCIGVIVALPLSMSLL
jgi:undecaprenyl-diphosphatase